MGAARWHHCCRRHNTVPIVLVAVADPVGAGFVESMARPGGNATGFIKSEYSLSGKLLEAPQARANNCLGSLLELRPLSLLGEERWLSYLNAVQSVCAVMIGRASHLIDMARTWERLALYKQGGRASGLLV